MKLGETDAINIKINHFRVREKNYERRKTNYDSEAINQKAS